MRFVVGTLKKTFEKPIEGDKENLAENIKQNIYIYNEKGTVMVNPTIKEEYHAGRDIIEHHGENKNNSKEPKSKKYIALGILIFFIGVVIIALITLIAMIFLNFNIETGGKIVMGCIGVDIISGIGYLYTKSKK